MAGGLIVQLLRGIYGAAWKTNDAHNQAEAGIMFGAELIVCSEDLLTAQPLSI